MKPVVSYLGARLGERSSQVQLVALALTGAVATGYVSMDQIQALAGKFGNILLVLGPLAGFLLPDRKPTADEVAQAAEAMIAASPQFAQMKSAVEQAEAAFNAAGGASVIDALGAAVRK